MKNIKGKKIAIAIVAIVLVVLVAIGVSVKASGSSGIAKSVTFTDNMDGAYVYFRAVDSAGNVGEWSEPQRIWIDNTAPTVTAKESSVTITEGEVNTLADYFTVVANGTNNDVDVVCTIGGTEYENTETLTVDGSPYTVTCTATKNGGKSNKAEMELVVEPSGPPAWDGTIATGFARGTGTETDPYIIETPQQLAYLASTTNSGTNYSGKYFKQEADLNLGGVKAKDGTWSGQEWIPIGTRDAFFRGSFSGGNYNISNLYVEDTTKTGVGLFGVTEGGNERIDSVRVVSGFVHGADSVGTIVGVMGYDTGGMLTNCFSAADVSGTSNVGGICRI